jgi:hypothetical protein
MAEWLKAAVLKTGQSTFGLPQIAPKLVVSGRKPADHHSVPACPDPPFADTITAQFAAQQPFFGLELAPAAHRCSRS